MKKYVFLVFLGFLFIGCSFSTLTVDTVPQGAMIYTKDKQSLGISPISTSISYDSIAEDKNTNCKDFGPLIAVWQSGAVTTIDESIVCKQPENIFILNRPKDYDGLDLDLAYEKYSQSKKTSFLAGLGSALNQAADGLNSHNPQYIQPNNFTMPSYNRSSFGNSNQYKYNTPTGNSYQYDMSNPSDRLHYSTDTEAQIRDRDNYPRTYIDNSLGYTGGGIDE